MKKIARRWPKSNQFSGWPGYISIVEFQSIQSDCNKNSDEELTLSLMPPQTLSEKVQLKKMQKYKIKILAKPGTLLSKPPWGIIM